MLRLVWVQVETNVLDGVRQLLCVERARVILVVALERRLDDTGISPFFKGGMARL